jgi:uncharacterized repeat protein (TIGR01451 family)
MFPRFVVLLFAALSCAQVLAQNPATAAKTAPLLFEPNRGQVSSEARFLANGTDYRILLTDQELVLLMQKGMGHNSVVPRKPGVLRLKWLGAKTASRFIGEQEQTSYSNYFTGSDQTRWQTRVPHFASVKQANVLPGIDLRFYGTARGELEYDLFLGPEVDTSQAGFEVIGADSVRVDKDGSLLLKVNGVETQQLPPRAYEVEGGRQRALTSSYVMRSKSIVGFAVQGRHPGSRLIIDPVLAYATYLGGAITSGYNTIANSSGTSTAVDNAGNVYVTGRTDALDFPVTIGAFQSQCPGPGSSSGCAARPVVFVAKFDRSGQHLLYATYLSGLFGAYPGDSAGKLLAVDAKGNAYIAGGAYGEFPVTSTAFQTQCAFEVDSTCAFLTKVSADGSQLLYSTYFGNGFPLTVFTTATGLALSPGGDVYFAGWTQAADLPTTPQAYQAKCKVSSVGACSSGFVARINPNRSGNASLVFATYLGGQNDSEADGVALDSLGNAYVVGLTNSDTFPHGAAFGTGTGPSAHYGFVPIEGSTFVAKLSPDGRRLLYSTLLRGASGTAIGVDAANQAFVAGSARKGFATTTGAAQVSFGGGGSDAFVTKLNPAGNALQYSTFLGGSGSDVARDLVLNNLGIAFLTGSTSSPNFPLRPGAFQLTHQGTTSFVTALRADGRSLYYSSYLGGSANSVGSGIAMDPAWNAFVTGTTGNEDFPVTVHAFQPTRLGSADAFWSKVVIAGDLRASLKSNVVSVPRNGVVTYNAQITNLGPDGSDNIVFTNPIPKGMSYAGVFSANGNGCSQPSVGATSGAVSCHKLRLEKGQTFYVNVYLRAVGTAGSTVTDIVKSSAQTQDLSPANNSAAFSVKIR